MPRGGKREGAGRKAQGITRKVSLTLEAKIWDEIKETNLTVAAYIRKLRESRKEIIAADESNSNDKL